MSQEVIRRKPNSFEIIEGVFCFVIIINDRRFLKMKQKRKLGRKLLSFLLTLALAVGLMPGMSLTAYAAPAETLLTTITPTGKTTYSETTSGVVTVSHNNDYYDGTYGWLWYSNADILTVSGCEGYTITKVIFKQNDKDPVTDSSAPFELHFDSMGEYGGVRCRENGRMDGVTSIEVYGYASKATQTITAEDVTVTYGDTDKSVSASTNGNGEISYAVKSGSEDYIDVASDGKLTINKVPAEGKAYVTVTAAETTTGGTGGNGYAAATKDVTVNISKAKVTITAKDQRIYVGGTVPTLSGADFYTITGLVGTDTLTTAPTLTYQKNDSAATPDSATAGTYDIVPSGASAGDNYNISYTNGTLTISEKQPATVTKAPEAKTLTYNGSAQELVTAGEAEGGEMQYAIGENATTAPADNLYGTSIPKGTDAETYYVWYKVVGNENYIDTEPACVKVTIAEKKEDSDKKDDTDTVSRPEYKNTSGAGASWSKGTTGTLDFTFKRTENDETTYDHFAGVKVDGKTVDAANYEKIKGSVIIKLKSSFLETLETGEHTLTAMFDDADEVTVPFEISAKAKQDDNKQTTVDTPTTKNDTPKKDTPKAPTTGDKINIGVIVMLMIDSSLAALYLTLKRKQIK